MGRNRTLTIPALAGDTFRSIYRTGVLIGSSASIAKTRLRQFSPQTVLASSDVFALWTQTEFKDGRPGRLRFDSHDGLCTMQLDLDYREGLYYCPTDVFTVDRSPVCRPGTHHLVSQPPLAQHAALHDSPLYPNLSRWSRRSGFFVWAHRVFISLASSPAMSRDCLRCLNIIHSASSTLRNRRGFGNKLHSAQLSAPRITGVVSIWILDLCEHLPLTTLAHKRAKIAWSSHMMGTRHTS